MIGDMYSECSYGWATNSARVQDSDSEVEAIDEEGGGSCRNNEESQNDDGEKILGCSRAMLSARKVKTVDHDMKTPHSLCQILDFPNCLF